ncbi:MAG TPA: alanine--tRNA ligase, partial [Spirochaetota bacterium]|nr:alanine--tRNA ligase [Spirochaetota bacterium]
MLKVKDLRQSYIDFFKSKGHRIIHSSPLIPKDDPTLLFTTAGMVQFKPMFAGTIPLEYTRAASIQKCLRTSDLERVGKTKRHCTFFEMLGNFSFGDYFKKEAIAFAWEYSTEVLKLPKEKLWVTVFENDDEAFEIWNKQVGVPAERIVRLGKADNFWGPAGDSGACGPCSELYIDKGPSLGCGKPDCKPGCDCERYMEYWNLVFNQYFQDTDGKQTPLPKTGIDTGMGLERLATIVQNCESIYETDELKTLVDFVCRELKVKYEGNNVPAVNAMVEHARALTFAMTDGAYPSNEGRGYVLRRILRRALRFGRQLGVREPFVCKMIDPIVELMGPFYPEIVSSAKNIKAVLEGEEKRFLETLENGIERLEEIFAEIEAKKSKQMSGVDAFTLYDTYGFPVEMTSEMAEERGFAVNMKEFESEMEKQRERGKSSWKGADNAFEQAMNDLAKTAGASEFTGYDHITEESAIAAMSDGKALVDEIKAGQKGFIVIGKTPFYAESGGQTGDTGTITSSDGAVFEVTDTKKISKTFVHHGEVKKGSFKKGAKVTASIDSMRRNLIKANHSVTHLLQAALRATLGEHVKQAGSSVDADRFRFDFSHFEAMKPEELEKVEMMVNEKIWENLPVSAVNMKIDEALKTGAMAEFGEKYGEIVRVVSMDDFSRELCGGTHVDNTGKIGLFKIVKESSPGAGMRRIEGVTLKGALERFNTHSDIVNGLMSDFNATEKDVPSKVKELSDRVSELQKEIAKLKSQSLASNLDAVIAKGVDVKGIKVIAEKFDGVPADDLRTLADMIRNKEQISVVILGSSCEGKASLLCAAAKSAVDRGADAGGVIKA